MCVCVCVLKCPLPLPPPYQELGRERLARYIPDAAGFADFSTTRLFRSYVDHAVRPSYEVGRDYPRLPELARDGPRCPEITRDDPR